MKNKLTKKEEELMIDVRNEWINRFNSLNFDEQKCKEFVNYCYELSNFKKPTILFLDSPLGCQYAKHIIMANVRANVWDNVRDNVWANVEANVRDNVRDNVEDNVRDNVRDSVRNNEIKYEYFCYRDCSDFGWVAFYDFFTKIGIINDDKFNKYKELIQCNIFMWLSFQNIAIVSYPPIFIQRDEQNRLHNFNDYAIYFKDGYGIHYVHGVYFDNEQFKQFFIEKKFSGKDILKLENSEQKAVLIQEYGYNKILKDVNAKILHTETKISQVTGKPCVSEVLEFKMDNNTYRVVKVEDHSVHKITTLGVPREKQTETVRGAIAWTFGLSEGDYEPIKES